MTTRIFRQNYLRDCAGELHCFDNLLPCDTDSLFLFSNMRSYSASRTVLIYTTSMGAVLKANISVLIDMLCGRGLSTGHFLFLLEFMLTFTINQL